jgi:hypothetical protein
MEDDNNKEEKILTCEKCGKQKKESEGVWVLSGSTFCCKDCCGEPASAEHKDKKDNVCEFC